MPCTDSRSTRTRLAYYAHKTHLAGVVFQVGAMPRLMNRAASLPRIGSQVSQTINHPPRCQIVRIEGNIQRNLTKVSSAPSTHADFAAPMTRRILDVSFLLLGFDFLGIQKRCRNTEVEPSAGMGWKSRCAKALRIRSVVPVVTKIDSVIATR